MSRRFKVSTWVLVASTGLALVEFANGGDQGMVFKTPQDAYQAFLEAGKKEDWKMVCQCLTANSRDLFAFGDLTAALFKKRNQFGNQKTREEFNKNFEKFENVLQKHGLTVEDIEKKMKQGEPKSKEPEAIKKAVTQFLEDLLEQVKDRTAFFVEVKTAVAKLIPDKKAPRGTYPSLEDVKTDGDTATGALVLQGGRVPVEFRRINSSWRVEFPFPASPPQDQK